ncbi:MAG: lipopolysaccharide biosynthesis protein [Flexilinea sp.]|nr:lipopolysaccharide biosynthesis protein [Flexilinea sp.]
MQSKRKIISNLFWRFAERTGAQLVSFVVSVVLARLLGPNDYGTIALITVFITILQVFVDSGLGNALIQKKDADTVDFSTVFYANILFCALLYIILFISAPFIASFYREPSMALYIRVLGITLLISGIKNVQQAYVSKKLIFRKFFFSTLGGTIIAGIVGIIMAFRGLGIWALIAQQIVNVTIDTCILWITVEWRPDRVFDLQRLRALFNYGWKLLVSSLINTVYKDIRQLIIGKIYTPASLAYYNQGEKIPNLITTNINKSIDSVLFPVMSTVQDENEHLKKMTRKSIMVSVYVMAPMMIGLVAVSNILIPLLLTEKWLPAVPFMRIFCITYLFYPIHTANLNAILAMGRSDYFLKLEIMKVFVSLTALFATMNISVEAMAYSLLFTSVASQIINSWPNWKLLNYSYIDQLKDILPTILLAVFMGGCVYLLQFLGLPDIITLILQVLLGAAIYIAGSMLFKLESFSYILEILRNMQITKRFFRNNGPDRTH